MKKVKELFGITKSKKSDNKENSPDFNRHVNFKRGQYHCFDGNNEYSSLNPYHVNVKPSTRKNTRSYAGEKLDYDSDRNSSFREVRSVVGERTNSVREGRRFFEDMQPLRDASNRASSRKKTRRNSHYGTSIREEPFKNIDDEEIIPSWVNIRLEKYHRKCEHLSASLQDAINNERRQRKENAKLRKTIQELELNKDNLEHNIKLLQRKNQNLENQLQDYYIIKDQLFSMNTHSNQFSTPTTLNPMYQNQPYLNNSRIGLQLQHLNVNSDTENLSRTSPLSHSNTNSALLTSGGSRQQNFSNIHHYPQQVFPSNNLLVHQRSNSSSAKLNIPPIFQFPALGQIDENNSDEIKNFRNAQGNDSSTSTWPDKNEQIEVDKCKKEEEETYSSRANTSSLEVGRNANEHNMSIATQFTTSCLELTCSLEENQNIASTNFLKRSHSVDQAMFSIVRDDGYSTSETASTAAPLLINKNGNFKN